MQNLSLNVPGSPSSAFTAINLGAGSFLVNFHFKPVGKPAPPSPLRFELSKILIISFGLILFDKHFFNILYPPSFL